MPNLIIQTLIMMLDQELAGEASRFGSIAALHDRLLSAGSRFIYCVAIPPENYNFNSKMIGA